MAKRAALAAHSLEGLHEPLVVDVPAMFELEVAVDRSPGFMSLQRKKREPLVPYPMRLRTDQVAQLQELQGRGVVPAEFIREALDAALRCVREAQTQSSDLL